MASKPIASTRPGAGAIIAAALLPPLGVYLVRGLGLSFWACVALTCLGIVPGSIFALLAVFRTGRKTMAVA